MLWGLTWVLWGLTWVLLGLTRVLWGLTWVLWGLTWVLWGLTWVLWGLTWLPWAMQGGVHHHCSAVARCSGRHVREGTSGGGAVWQRGGAHGGTGQPAEQHEPASQAAAQTNGES